MVYHIVQLEPDYLRLYRAYTFITFLGSFFLCEEVLLTCPSKAVTRVITSNTMIASKDKICHLAL